MLVHPSHLRKRGLDTAQHYVAEPVLAMQRKQSTSSNMPQATNLHTVCPSPLLRGVGTITGIPSKDPTPPLPSPEGCGRLIVARRKSWGTRNTRRWCVTETDRDICHGPLSLIFPASNKLTQLVSFKRQVATKKKTATTTMVETTAQR